MKKRNLRQKTSVVVNMGDSMLTLVKLSVVEKEKRYNEAKEALKKQAENYNASVDHWYDDPESYSQTMLWNEFQKLIVSYQRYSTERYMLVVNGKPLTTGEESMINKILDDLTLLTKDED